MLLGFKARFAPFVEEGSKTHTIRAKRKVRPRVGETCHCYTGLRQKGARCLGRFQCVAVQRFMICRISIDPTIEGLAIYIDGAVLSNDERESFFWQDGFRLPGRSSTQQAFDFWAGVILPFDGDIIHWKYLPGTANGTLKSLKRPAGRTKKP